MMRLAAYAAALCAIASPALAAGIRVDVSAGEHGTYSRIVFPKGVANVEIEKNARMVRLHKIDASLVYGLQEINDRQKAHRISAARRITAADGDAIELFLNCDCEIKSSRLGDGKFVLDVFEGEAIKSVNAQPAAKKAETQKTVEEADRLSVEQAHKQMVELLKQAAREGLVTIQSPTGEAAQQANNASQETSPSTQATKAPTDLIAQTLAQAEQESATPPVNQVEDARCFADAAFLIDGGEFDDAPLVQIAALQTELAETHAPDNMPTVKALAHGYLSIGFGEEALALLIDYGEEHSLLADMARAVADQPVIANSRLHAAQNCDGAHALWQAVSTEPEAAATLYRRSNGALSALPNRLKAIIGARLAISMIAAEAWPLAEELYATLSSDENASSADLEYVAAMLEKHKGETESATDALRAVAAKQTDTADDAMLALAEQYLENQTTPYDGFTEDIGAVAKLQGSSQAALAEAIAWANVGNIDAALLLFESVIEKSPENTELARRLAHTVFDRAFSSGDPLQELAALDAFIEHQDWFSLSSDDIATRRKIAGVSLKLGLPNIASTLLDGAAENGDIDLLKDKAAAALAAGRSDEAIRIAAPYTEDAYFREIIVNANLRDGKYNDALAAASTVQDVKKRSELTARSAWLARSWKSVVKSLREIDPTLLTEDNAFKLGMAAYSAGEATLPAAVDAILSENNSTVAAGLRSIFAAAPTGSALQRSQRQVEETSNEILMIEELLSDG